MLKFCPVCAGELIGHKFCHKCGTFHIVWTPRVCYFYLMVHDELKQYMITGAPLEGWKCVARNSDSTMLQSQINTYKVMGYEEFRG